MPMQTMYGWLINACLQDKLRYTVFYKTTDTKVREHYVDTWITEDEQRILKIIGFKLNGRRTGAEILMQALCDVYGNEGLKDPLLFKLYQSACEVALQNMQAIGMVTEILQSDIFFASFKLVCDQANCREFFDRLFDPQEIDNSFEVLVKDIKNQICPDYLVAQVLDQFKVP